MDNMSRLIVNPGTESAWEIPLQPGAISLGRGPENTFPIEHPSVSSAHCQLTMTDSGVVIKDLGSVNGTFVNDAMVDEAPLFNGQTLRLGDVVMQFESDQIPRARPMRDAVIQPQAGIAAFCKFHPHAAAQFLCPKCRKTFCALCVNLRQGRHFCRACGVECSMLEPAQAQAAPDRSFFSQACGAFAYPLKGDGVILLICGGFLFLLIDGAAFLARFAFIYGLIALIFLTVFGVGYLTRFLQNIVVTSARGENEIPDWPDLTDYSSEVTTPFFQMLGIVVFCFAPAIGLTIYAIFSGGGAWLGWATTASIFFGAIYFPMAFTAVAMFDSLGAVNPLLIIPSILKIPKEYALAIALFVVILILRWLGEKVLPELLGIPYILPSIIANFFGLYLLAVEMRILGLLCRTKKDELGWSGS
jgi:hypothetical protein